MSHTPKPNQPKSPEAVALELGAIAREILTVQADVSNRLIDTRDDLNAATGRLLKCMERLSEAKFDLWRSLTDEIRRVDRDLAPYADRPMPYEPLLERREPNDDDED